MGFFKNIIRLFKKPPPPPRRYMRYDRSSSMYDQFVNAEIRRIRIPTDEEIIRSQNNFQELLNAHALTQEQIRHIREYYSNICSPDLSKTRKRIPVNKEVDPFEEEIWYEDETKTN